MKLGTAHQRTLTQNLCWKWVGKRACFLLALELGFQGLDSARGKTRSPPSSPPTPTPGLQGAVGGISLLR